MAVAGDGEGEHPVLLAHVEAGRAQGEQAARRAAGQLGAPQLQAGHPAGGGAGEVCKPCGRLAGQVGPQPGLPRRLFHLLGGEGDGGAVVGHPVPLGAVHRHQVGQGLAPHRRRVLGGAGGGGEKHRLDGPALIGEHLAVGVRHGGGNFGGVGVGIPAPALGGVLLGEVGLAAGGVGADIRALLLVAFGPQLPQGVGPGAHRLGPEGLRLEGGGHLRRHHAPQVVPHGQLVHLPGN